jgi:hypothetical protein
MSSLEEARAVKEKLKKVLTDKDSIGIMTGTSGYAVKVYLHNLSLAGVFPTIIDGVEIVYLQLAAVTKQVADQ